MKEFVLPDLERVMAACVGTENVGSLDAAALDTPFDELGLDSLAVYEVVTRLQDELSLSISDDEIETSRTPRLLIELVNDRLGARARQGADT